MTCHLLMVESCLENVCLILPNREEVTFAPFWFTMYGFALFWFTVYGFAHLNLLELYVSIFKFTVTIFAHLP